MVPGFKVEGVNNFLSNDYIRRNMSVSNKSSLSMINVIGKVRLNPISNRLGYDFSNNIAKTDRPKVLRN